MRPCSFFKQSLRARPARCSFTRVDAAHCAEQSSQQQNPETLPGPRRSLPACFCAIHHTACECALLPQTDAARHSSTSILRHARQRRKAAIPHASLLHARVPQHCPREFADLAISRRQPFELDNAAGRPPAALDDHDHDHTRRNTAKPTISHNTEWRAVDRLAL